MQDHVEHQVAFVLVRDRRVYCLKHFLCLCKKLNTFLLSRLNLGQSHGVHEHCLVGDLSGVPIDSLGHLHSLLCYGDDLLKFFLSAHSQLFEVHFHLCLLDEQRLHVVFCRKPLACQDIGSLNATDRFVMLGHIRVLIRGSAQNLDHFRLAHVRPRRLLRQIVEVCLVHELLILGHLVELNANGFLLVPMLTDKDVLVDSLCL